MSDRDNLIAMLNRIQAEWCEDIGPKGIIIDFHSNGPGVDGDPDLVIDFAFDLEGNLVRSAIWKDA